MENSTKVICIGYLEKGTGQHQSNSVYKKNGLCPCIMAGLGTKMQGIFTVVENNNEQERKCK